MESLKKLETELKIRGFSQQTIFAYLKHNNAFLAFIMKPSAEVTEDDIKSYLAELIAVKKLAASSVALTRSALLFYYNQILGKRFDSIKTPKIHRKQPVVLTKEEIKMLLDACQTIKSRLLVELLYSSGLRVSECLALRIGDIDCVGGLCSVKKGKGNKERTSIISKGLSEKLEAFMSKRKGDLIFSNSSGKQLSIRNAEKIVSLAAHRAGIRKKVTPHKLRHSFATHLLDSGVNIRVIQELLGHSNLQTTQIYTQVSKEHIKTVKNPLDNL